MMKKTILSILLVLLFHSIALAAPAIFFGDRSGPITLLSSSFTLTQTGTVVPAVSGKKIKVFVIKLVAAGNMGVNWRDGASTSLEGSQTIPDGGGYVETVTPPAFLFSTSTSTSLDLVTSGTGTVSGRVSYWNDDSY